MTAGWNVSNRFCSQLKKLHPWENGAKMDQFSSKKHPSPQLVHPRICKHHQTDFEEPTCRHPLSLIPETFSLPHRPNLPTLTAIIRVAPPRGGRRSARFAQSAWPRVVETRRMANPTFARRARHTLFRSVGQFGTAGGQNTPFAVRSLC